MPQVQVSLYDEQGSFLGRPDLYYPAARLGLEYDGASHRGSLPADNRRQNQLHEAGYLLLRFTATDVLNTPLAVVATVRRTLSART
jgi:very-short-patch-repair endonuclease